jgi:hypothetical protein
VNHLPTPRDCDPDHGEATCQTCDRPIRRRLRGVWYHVDEKKYQIYTTDPARSL